MWYVADLLFAQPAQPEHGTVLCETCDVLLEAGSALEAYDKAIDWAAKHVEIENPGFRFIGVRHIHSLSETLPGDGTEIGGTFFEEEAVWSRIDSLIPQKEDIPIIMWEQHMDTPIGELMSEKQERYLKRLPGS